MKKHFISIILLLFSLFAVTSAHARLTLGVVVDSEGKPGLMQSSQVDNLVAQLRETLQEEIIVKEMPDAATVIDWLNQYAALDMALLSQEAVNTFRGRILFVGAVDKDGQINLVARQGGNVEVTEKVAEFVKSAGFSPWRPADTDGVALEVVAEAPPAEKEPRSIDDLIEAAADGGPQTTYYEAREPLLLAVIPELKGVLQSTSEAEQLAGYLESTLPVEVKVKEFGQVDQFAEWFMRFRMVDLAVVSKGLAETKLGRDYIAIAAFDPEEGDVDAAELLIGRRGDNASLQNQLKQVLLNAQQSSPGKKLLTSLGIQAVKKPEAGPVGVVTESPDTVELPGESSEAPKVVGVPVVPKRQDVEFPEPVEPVPPPAPVLPAIPERPRVAMQTVPPEPAAPDLVPALPGTIKAPSTPESLSPPQRTRLPELPETVEIPDQVALPKTPDLPAVAKSPQSPQQIALPGSPGEKIDEPVEPVISKAEVAAPVLPVVPAEVETPALPVMPEATSLPESPEMASIPGQVSAPQGPDLPATVEVPVPPLKIKPPETSEAINRDAAESVTQAVGPAPVSEAANNDVSTSVDQTGEPVVTEKKELLEEQKIIQEVLEFAEPVSSQQAGQIRPVMVSDEDLQDDDILALLGEDTVAALVAQPEIPQELRPPGIPVVRPGLIVRDEPVIDQGLLLTSLPETVERNKPAAAPQVLPDPEQDQNLLYIVPFVAIMVPREVNDRIFDRFVDALLEESENLDLDIVILKDGLKGIDSGWLRARKYVTGEIYGYIEETGSDVIDLRAKAKLAYHTPDQETPTFSYLYPVSKFLDRDSSIIEEERIQLADNIAETLITEFLDALKK